jgi:hypothetical protein
MGIITFAFASLGEKPLAFETHETPTPQPFSLALRARLADDIHFGILEHNKPPILTLA